MRKKLWKSFFLMLLTVLTVLSSSTVSFADWEDYGEDDTECCWCNNAITGADNYCDCGGGGGPHCSDSYDTGCFDSYHCENFGACGNTRDDCNICDDCNYCSECQYLNGVGGLHCSGCDNCGSGICEECAGDDDQYCEDCAIEKGLHCADCGGCFQSNTVCDHSGECNGNKYLCEECCDGQGFHCKVCGKHVEGGGDDGMFWCFCDSGPDDHCGYCGMEDYGGKYCSGCGRVLCEFNGDDPDTEFCEDCDLCLDCCYEKLLHCPECDAENIEPCEFGGQHCQNYCCVICEECDRCVEALDIEICTSCGLCVECCLERAEEAGCTCGEYCVESTDFDDHFCAQCGICFDETDQCEYCGLCETCSEENSDCSDGMCINDPEYEDHFCEVCSECFHEVDVCDTCAAAGVNRCTECCLEDSESLGCEHGICPNSDYWHCHYDDANGKCYDTDQHTYPIVRYIVISKTRIPVYGDTCSVCGYHKDGTPVINTQPTDKTVKVAASADTADKVSFRVSAMGDNLTYQWYYGNDTKVSDSSDGLISGATTPVLTIGTTACNEYLDALLKADPENIIYQTILKTNTFYCVVTNSAEDKSVTSDSARLYTKHNESGFRKDVITKQTIDYIPPEGGHISISYDHSTTHSKACVGGTYGLTGISKVLQGLVASCDQHTVTEPHTWTAWDYTVYPASRGHLGYARRICTKCGAWDIKEFKYVEEHEHVWSDTPVPVSVEVDVKDANGNVTGTKTSYQYHVYPCTVEGCPEQSAKEQHVWSGYVETVAPTDHSKGERSHTCLLCGYVEAKEIDVIPHVHDFPVKKTQTRYATADSQYVRRNAKGHYTICKGYRYISRTGEYVPCNARTALEPHNFSVTRLDEGTDKEGQYWVKFEYYCPTCGYKRNYKSFSETTTSEHLLFSEMTEFEWYVSKYNIRYYSYSKDEGNPAAIPADAVVTVFNDTGYLFDEETWSLSIYTIPDLQPVEIVSCNGYRCDFIMPDNDVYIQVGLATHTLEQCKHSKTYYDYSTAILGTCTESGKEPDKKCSLCKNTLKIGEAYPAYGHEWVLQEDTYKEPTCTAQGYTGKSICDVCGKVQQGDAIPANGHLTEGNYDYDENKHWPYCEICDKGFKADGEKHDFGEPVEANGAVYEFCKTCRYYHVIDGTMTGLDFDHTIYITDQSDSLDIRVRFYPTTTETKDIIQDMAKDTSELGTQYKVVVYDTYATKYRNSTRAVAYLVLNAPKGKQEYKIAISLGKEYRPWIETRTNYNMSGLVRLWGDVDLDGAVNRADVTILSRYVAKWDGYDTQVKDMDLADIDGDGTVNRADATFFSRYIAKWGDLYENTLRRLI